MPEPAQHARFCGIRTDPPAGVRAALSVEESSVWKADRLGSEGGFPNGGMWRFRNNHDPAASVVVKRTGPHHLGTDHVWRGSADPAQPQWWGLEAEFYLSELARDGWDADCRAAVCFAVDDHDGVRDLWLEDVSGIPTARSRYDAVVSSLARWQMHHRGTDLGWLSRAWIPTHLRRRGLDNARTLAHPGWNRLVDLGIPAGVRDSVRRRITDPATCTSILDSLPQTLTHYDFHHMNLGEVDGQLVIIDWATVGWGPVGHDAGFMLVDHAFELGNSISSVWDALIAAYAAALRDAGGGYSPAHVRRSAAISNVIRLGWSIDHLLDGSAAMSDQQIIAGFPFFSLLADLQAQYLPGEDR